MELIKQSENYSIKDTYKDMEVNGSVNVSSDNYSLNINVNSSDMKHSMYANATIGQSVSVNFNCPKEERVDFALYVNELIDAVSNNDAVANS